MYLEVRVRSIDPLVGLIENNSEVEVALGHICLHRRVQPLAKLLQEDLCHSEHPIQIGKSKLA